MNIQIDVWKDHCGDIREKIVRDIIDIMFRFFHNDALFINDLQIVDITDINCPYADENPCTHFDRSRVCLNAPSAYWCQFLHQLNHELCHCSTSCVTLPQKIKWFDEFICCCSAYLVEKIIAQNNHHKYDAMFLEVTSKIFTDYLLIEQEGHIYHIDNSCDFFEKNKENYLRDENLIKKHDVYVRSFFDSLQDDFSGLSFVGKMCLVQIENDMYIGEYLLKLLALCNKNEKATIYQICKNICHIKNLVVKDMRLQKYLLLTVIFE